MIDDCNEFPSKGFGGDMTADAELIALVKSLASRLVVLESAFHRLLYKGSDE